MNQTRPATLGIRLATAMLAVGMGTGTTALAQATTAMPALEAAALRESEATVKAFNAADAAALAGMFLESGELVEEAGSVHTGKVAITRLFSGFFGKFPKATLEMLVDSARPWGDTLAVEEGQRRITTADGTNAQVRYVAVRSRQGDRWPIASYREFADDPLPTPREVLQGASWIVGDVEAPDFEMTIACKPPHPCVAK